MTRSWYRSNLAFALLVMAGLVYLLNVQLSHLGPGRTQGHEKENLMLAYHLYHHQVFSVDGLTYPEPRPTALRALGFPLFLAGGLALLPEVAQLPPEQYLAGVKRPSDSLRPLKYLNIGLFLLLALVVLGLTTRLTGSRWAGFAVSMLFGHSTLASAVNGFSEEILASLFLMAFTLAWLAAWQRPKRRYFLFAGVLLALLTLTRPAFWYLFPLLLLAWGIRAWRRPADRRQMVLGMVAFFLPFLLLTGAWRARNLYHFDRASFSRGGGQILAIRAQYNTMSWEERKLAFLVWTPCPEVRSYLVREYPFEAYERFVRSSGRSFLKSGMRQIGPPAAQLGGWDAADQALMKASLERIRDHPLDHLVATVPIAYRGLFVEQPPLCYLNYLLWLSFFSLLLGAAWSWYRARRSGAAPPAWVVAWWVVLLPFWFNIAFHAGITHNIVRYQRPLIPFLWVSVGVLAWRLHRWWADRKVPSL